MYGYISAGLVTYLSWSWVDGEMAGFDMWRAGSTLALCNHTFFYFFWGFGRKMGDRPGKEGLSLAKSCCVARCVLCYLKPGGAGFGRQGVACC
ncbi:hypothetical protein BT67DRAFT_1565 [Trichocladium antarcticum]|uniref:Uncharacterized protein n=1 Tax=Trichocladium antarcticum TaxID=1450529 RepID=A0AAN6ZGE4_9PEZI|nr:hypothetical protein BT67DRAFT_1565 [Trichocladium antarcticum]